MRRPPYGEVLTERGISERRYNMLGFLSPVITHGHGLWGEVNHITNVTEEAIMGKITMAQFFIYDEQAKYMNVVHKDELRSKSVKMVD